LRYLDVDINQRRTVASVLGSSQRYIVSYLD
jgi:hypothetical protein